MCVAIFVCISVTVVRSYRIEGLNDLSCPSMTGASDQWGISISGANVIAAYYLCTIGSLLLPYLIVLEGYSLLDRVHKANGAYRGCKGGLCTAALRRFVITST